MAGGQSEYVVTTDEIVSLPYADWKQLDGLDDRSMVEYMLRRRMHGAPVTVLEMHYNWQILGFEVTRLRIGPEPDAVAQS